MKTLKSLQERKELLESKLKSLKRKNRVHFTNDEHFQIISLERALDNVNVNINQVKQKQMNH